MTAFFCNLLGVVFCGPDAGDPQHGEDEKRLERQAGPGDPGLGGDAMNLEVSGGHVDVGRKNGHEEQSQAPTGEEFDAPYGNQQPDSAEQLKNAADFDAGMREGNPWRHDGQKKVGIDEMDRAGEEEKRGEKKTNDAAGGQASKIACFPGGGEETPRRAAKKA